MCSVVEFGWRPLAQPLEHLPLGCRVERASLTEELALGRDCDEVEEVDGLPGSSGLACLWLSRRAIGSVRKERTRSSQLLLVDVLAGESSSEHATRLVTQGVVLFGRGSAQRRHLRRATATPAESCASVGWCVVQ